MINIPLPEDNLFERLKTRTGYAEFIQNFADRLLSEPAVISRTVLEMEKSLVNPARERAEEWARVHDVVAKAMGLKLEQEAVYAKQDMERRGENLVGVTPVDTPEVVVPQIQPVAPDTNVFNLDEIRARIDGLHIPTTEQLEEVIRPFGLDEAA